jgi:hypothetical protein
MGGSGNDEPREVEEVETEIKNMNEESGLLGGMFW